jgi:hypothetical protein
MKLRRLVNGEEFKKAKSGFFKIGDRTGRHRDFQILPENADIVFLLKRD